jgi:AraC family transcriptional regulator, transcriptional activator FtrA
MSPATPLTGPMVVALGFDGVPFFELGIASEVFGLPRPEFGADWYRFALASEGGAAVRTSQGWSLSVDGDLSLLEAADLVIVPGWPVAAGRAVPERIAAAIRAAAARGSRIASICSGAFLLAELGLLDGKRAATHWRYAPLLAERYGTVAVSADILFADEGQVLTSAGSAAGIDLLLHIVRRDYGVARANAVAKRLVLPAQREGNQRQFADAPPAPAQSDRLAEVMARIMAHPEAPWPIARIAREAGMSERTLARAVVARASCAPGTYVIKARVARARELLETTPLAVEQVAMLSGFGSATSLQQHFRRQIGRSPTGYRRDFAPAPDQAGSPAT